MQQMDKIIGAPTQLATSFNEWVEKHPEAKILQVSDPQSMASVGSAKLWILLVRYEIAA
jgi:hypothetical protein